MITHKYLKSLMNYDSVTGIFTWKHRSDVNKTWNSKYAARRAGRLRADGYWELIINKRYYKASRVAWFYITGNWPIYEIDHKDLNKSNNSFDNLREATPHQNQCNHAKTRINTSGYKGVTKTGLSRWTARIKINKYHKHLGCFDSPEKAHMAYCNAAKKYHGEFARFA